MADEHFGTTPRRKMTPARRLRIFEAAGGRCWRCGNLIRIGEKWIAEHVRPLELGGEDDDKNMSVTHEQCAIEKTRDDHTRAAKAKRSKIKLWGMSESRNPMPGSRRSKWKRRMDGTVVRREE